MSKNKKKCSKSWVKSAVQRVWALGHSPPTHAAHTAVFPLWSHILYLCGSVEKHRVWTAATGSLQCCGSWNGVVVLFIIIQTSHSVLTDDNIWESLTCLFKVCSFVGSLPYSICLLALFGSLWTSWTVINLWRREADRCAHSEINVLDQWVITLLFLPLVFLCNSEVRQLAQT